MPLTFIQDHDTLVLGSCDLTGAFPCTAVRPDDPIQDRGHDTVHGKGQRAESKDQRADMCTDGQPDVLCVLTDGHGRPVCADGHTRTSVCVLNRQPTWAKITHGQPKSPEKPKMQKLIFLKKVF